MGEINQEGNHYLIPKNINARFEFFPGFGWRELLVTSIGLGIGIMFCLLFSLFGLPLILRVIIILVFTAAGFFICVEDPRIGLSMLGIFKAYKEFSRKPKRYLYIHGEK